MQHLTDIKVLLDTRFPTFEPELKELICVHSKLKTFAQGDTIVQSGQLFHSVLLIVDGRLKFYRQDESGDEILIYDILPGDACALSMASTPYERPSQTLAIAAEDSRLLMIPISATEVWMQRYKSWNLYVVETYRKRFEEMISMVDQMAFMNMGMRLKNYLHSQVLKTGKQQVFLTHGEIARDLNSSREVISRLLKEMEKSQEVKVHRHYVEVYD